MVNMTEETRIKIKPNSPVAISSTVNGANINALGFNIDLIASKNPNLAIEIMRLFELAKQINSSNNKRSDEDFATAIQQLAGIFDEDQDRNNG